MCSRTATGLEDHCSRIATGLQDWVDYNCYPRLCSSYCLMVVFNDGLRAKHIHLKTETKIQTHLIINVSNSIAT